MSGDRRGAAIPYRACALTGLGGLFAGVTGPLLSIFIPPRLTTYWYRKAMSGSTLAARRAGM